MASLIVRCVKCKTYQSANNQACQKCGLSFKKVDARVVYVRYSVRGKERREKVGCVPLAVAREVKAKIETDIAEGRLDKVAPPPGAKIPAKEFFLGQYANWCRTNNRGFRQKLPYIRMVAKFFQDKPLAEITAWDCERFKQWRIETPKQRTNKPVKPATVNRALATLKHGLSKSMEWGLIPENPASKVKLLAVENSQVDFLSVEQIKALISACGGLLRDIVVVALGTGARRGELLSLSWGQVDFKNRAIHLTKTKSGRARVIPMNQSVYETLARLKEKTSSEWVFESPRTGRAFVDLKNGLREAYKRAGIPIKGRPFHLLRHTWASHMVMNGCDLYSLMKLGGWQSPEMVQRYAHLSRQFQEKIMGTMDGVLSPQEEKVVTLA